MKNNLLVLTDSGKLTENLTVLLSSLGIVKEVKSFKAWFAELDKNEVDVPDVIIYDETAPFDVVKYRKGLNQAKTEHRMLFDVCRYKSKTKFFGFGLGATYLAVLNGCDILESIDNHDVEHSATFILEGYDTIQANVPSNHDTIMYPVSNRLKNFSIKAFSTYNKSNRYKNRHGEFIKMHDKFVEPEIISFGKSKCVAFQYTPPPATDSLAFSLTLENMKK